MAGNRTRFLRICMPRVIIRSLSAYRREKPLALSQYTLGRSTDSVMDSDDNLSYTVPIVSTL